MTQIERELKQAMIQHQLDDPPVVTVPRIRQKYGQSWTALAAAMAAIVVCAGAILIVKHVVGTDRLPVTSPTNTAAVASSSTNLPTSSVPQRTKEDILRSLAASVPNHPSAGEPTDRVKSPPGGLWEFDRETEVASNVQTVVDWYRKNLKNIGGVAQLRDGHAELYLAGFDTTDTDSFVELQLKVLIDSRGPESTAVVVRASGFARGERSVDSRIPLDSLVSATLVWVENAEPQSHTRQLDLDSARALGNILNNAPVLPLITRSAAGSGTYYELRLATASAQYVAISNTAVGGGGAQLNVNGSAEQLLDVPAGYFTLLEKLSGP